jgi:signal transduction histidine kinase
VVSRHATKRRLRQPPALWALAAAGAVAAVAGAALGSFPATLGGLDLAALALVAGQVSLLRAKAAQAALAADRERRLADLRAAELTHLATVRLPALTEGVRHGRGAADVPGPLTTPEETGADFAQALTRIVDSLADDGAARRERSLRESAQSAFERSAETLYVMATAQQQRLARLVAGGGESGGAAEELRAADRAARQLSRKAQTLLVLCGAWPVPRESRPVPLRECVDRALHQIVEHDRVEVGGGGGTCVVPHVVDGLTHTLAELLENATTLSPSGTSVAVSLHQTPRNAVIRIEDAGVGMPPDVLAEAARRLRGGLELAQLGAVPRLGLACAGRWAHALGFGVELGPAPEHGGVRVEIVLPDRLLTGPPAPPEHGRAGGPLIDLPRTARVDHGAGEEASARPAAVPGRAGERARDHAKPLPGQAPAPADDATDAADAPGAGESGDAGEPRREAGEPR